MGDAITFFDQHEFDIRFKWGERGLATIAPVSDVVLVVAVLSFMTSVDIAVAHGTMVLPYRSSADSAAKFATANDAFRAGHRHSDWRNN